MPRRAPVTGQIPLPGLACLHPVASLRYLDGLREVVVCDSCGEVLEAPTLPGAGYTR